MFDQGGFENNRTKVEQSSNLVVGWWIFPLSFFGGLVWVWVGIVIFVWMRS